MNITSMMYLPSYFMNASATAYFPMNNKSATLDVLKTYAEYISS